MAEKLTAQQRAQLFAMSTRQNIHMLGSETATALPKTLTFTLPKSRLLAGAFLEFCIPNISADVLSGLTVTDFYNIIRRISLDLNNGFQPFVLSGEELGLYNAVDIHGAMYHHAKSEERYSMFEHDSVNNVLKFYLPLNVVLDRRIPTGLILLQNDTTNVKLTIDLANIETEYTNITVNVCLETFSIPANQNAYPDLSVLKLVNGVTYSLPTTGNQIVKLNTGTIYRKLIFKISDADGNPVADTDINAPFQLVFNQADINYSIDSSMLRALNKRELGFELPEGVYMFDFSNAGGFPNMGGTRDYIDTANLTEFWLKFGTAKIGKVDVITECLARLS